MDLLMGRIIDKGRVTLEEYRLPAEDLMTHCVICGSTGSGKTVLGKLLIEETSRAGIPSILIDLKGDLSAMAIPIGSVNYTEFEPWIDARTPEEKREKAKEMVELYKSSMKKTGVSPEEMEEFRNGVDIRIFTPRATAGEQVSLSLLGSPETLGSMDKLQDGTEQNILAGPMREVFLNMLSVTTAFIMERIFPGKVIEELLRERAFLECALQVLWLKGGDLSGKKGIIALIKEVLTPTMERVGVFRIEQFISADERGEIARRLNTLLVGSEALWYEGTAIDSIIRNMDKPIAGRTRVAIFNLSFLERFEDRNMVVSQIGFTIFNHFRKKVDAIGPRIIFYIDEIGSGEQSYFPAEPFYNSSKAAINLLLRQGRAFGICTVLSTQNPGDIDYKGLTNCHTWFIGKLLTFEDRQKVIEGIASQEQQFEDVDDIIKTAETGEFIVKTRRGEVKRFRERWLFTFHKVVSHDEFGKIHKALESKQNYLNGIHMFQTGRIAEALDLFSKALERDPRDAKAWGALGEVHESGGDYEKAVAAYKRAREISNLDDNCWICEARMLYTLQRHDESLQAFREASKLNRENVDSWYMQGVILFEKGEFKAADESLKEALKHNTRHFESWYMRGLVHEVTGKIQQARDFYEKALEFNSESALYNESLGSALFQLGQYILSLESYEKSIFLDKTRIEPRFGRARVFVELEDYDKALEEIDRVLEMEPGHNGAMNLRAEMAWRAGNFERAANAFRELLILEPSNLDALRGLGISLFRAGQKVEAEKILESVCGHFQADLELWQTLAGLRDEKSDSNPEASLQAYQIVDGLLPDDPQIVRQIALLTLKVDKGKAIEVMKRSFELNSDDPEIAEILGELLLEAGDEKSVPAYWEKVIGSPRADHEFNLRLARVYRSIGNDTKALDAVTRALRLKIDMDVMVEKGMLYHALKRYDDALDTYDIVVKQDPEHSGAWQARAETFRIIGEEEKAKYCEEQASRFHRTEA
ncbi:MAG: hypothetical protein CVV64_07795 [Candidatus Wallbacteria bacterium HGW-Wallbacteria-1]|uniref:Helicase HerA-like C-terminal domain-containing protein n=1 Tax=Candidatus Wallbacteria bacterium HGW-Wallbacteria-1 TaxID=2013854 RepID=A0A2N1PQZ6_9BACT|nr:MAG: hypothetical protein CVV64_07795 [Candidatus Wallbacteria bacterium HGW-Wallbacteria-1]